MSDSSTPRRTFLGQLAATTVGLHAAALVRPAHALTVTSEWDDSWTTRLGSSHRFVFDLAQPNSANGVFDQIATLRDDFQAALGAGDSAMHMVLVVRHSAIAAIFSDAIWTKYKLGDANPSRSGLEAFQQRGGIVLGCHIATMNRVRQFAKDSGASEADVEKEVRANLVGGAILQPNGIYALNRAQDAGCSLYRGGGG